VKAIRWISPLFTFYKLVFHFSHAWPAGLAARVICTRFGIEMAAGV